MRTYQKYEFNRLELTVIKHFTLFTGKHMCWSLSLINLQARKPETLLIKDSNTGVFL